MIRAGIRRVFHLSLRGRSRWERDVEDEIRLHLELRAETKNWVQYADTVTTILTAAKDAT